ncbi:MAG: phosphotransferase [Chloroflexi bacterium]|nr:phosphotransferase [Chloroflexota bacterium]MDA1226362.1 phosphotransferase [Chloroflexota bacterium]
MARVPFENLTHTGKVRRLHTLAKTALKSYGLKGASVRLIKSHENATFRVSVNDRSGGKAEAGRFVQGRYLLKLHGPGYQSAASIASELEWLDALRRDIDLAVPEPVPTLSGDLMTTASSPDVPEPRVCSLLRWMNGRAYQKTSPTHLTAIGEVMGQLHSHAEGWSPSPAFTRRRLDWDGLLGDSAGFVVSPQETWSSLPSPYARLFHDMGERVRQAMEELGFGPDVFGLIHADLHTGNILFSANETRVIDFDDSAFGHKIYDIAVCLLQNGHPTLVDDLFRGYTRHRPIPVEQLEYLDIFIAARQLSNAMWVFGKTDERQDDHRTDASRWLEFTAQSFKSILKAH